MAHVDGREAAEDLLVVVENPLPDGALLGVQLGLDHPRHYAVARAEDVVADDAFERQLLAPLLALDEEAQLLRETPQRLDDIARRIAARAAGAARHALAAVPDGIALEQRLDGLVVARLDGGDNLARVVVVELGRRADTRADAAVHAGVEPLAEAHVLAEHIEVFSHNRVGSTPCTARLAGISGAAPSAEAPCTALTGAERGMQGKMFPNAKVGIRPRTCGSINT